MSYSQTAVDQFWWGTDKNGNPGSATNILPGAYVTMSAAEVVSLLSPLSAVYAPGFAAMWNYMSTPVNGVYPQPTGANGFADKDRQGGVVKPFSQINRGLY
jgi:hypothetical protein